MTDELLDAGVVDPFALATPLGYPYPSSSDPVAQGAAAIQALATKLDTGPIATNGDLKSHAGTAAEMRMISSTGIPVLYFGPGSNEYWYLEAAGKMTTGCRVGTKGMVAHRHPYLLTDRHIESGRVNLPASSQTSIVFTDSFGTLPNVVISHEAIAGGYCVTVALYPTSVLIQNFSGNGLICNWIADGPD